MRMRKGFTLLEMLIVIVTLGILSAVMLLSSLEAVSTADANNIINNMQQIKVAVYAWYKDNRSRIIPDNSAGYKIRTNGTNQYFSEFVRDHKDEILQYLDNKTLVNLRANGESPNNTGDYSLIMLKNNKYWYVCCNLGTTSTIIKDHGSESPELMVKRKLAGRAKTLNLSGKSSIDNDNDNMEETIYNDQKFVCMPILQLP